MEITRIRKKYCVDGKVQIMFSNAPSQVILSSDGFIYLRDGDTTIHRYLADPIRKKMPYKNMPSSKDHATHLFEYDKLYAKFTSYRNMGRGYSMEDCHTLTFLYFVRTENGEALCAEFRYSDFKSDDEIEEIMSKEDLERFLYDLTLSEADAKCILDWQSGMKYVRHKKEAICLTRENFLPLDDASIIAKANAHNEPIYSLIFDDELRKKKMEDKSWMVHSVDEIHDLYLTHRGMLGGYNPVQLVIRGNKMYLHDFEVVFVGPGKFKLRNKRYVIEMSYNEILKRAHNVEYSMEPDFDQN